MRRSRLTIRDRSAAIGLTFALHLVLLALLFWLTPDMIAMRQETAGLSIFNMPAEKQGAAQADHSRENRVKAERTETPPHPEHPELREKPVMPPPKVEVPGMILLNPEEFAASDIGKIKGRQANSGASGQNAGPVYGPGEGPGGMQLYNAQWYREPTDAELSGYLPADGPRNGYGLIACQTIADFHVDHCRILGESPLGSGLGQAVRRAAWQFRVVPPRINGSPQIGAWVRIRIEYMEGQRRFN